MICEKFAQFQHTETGETTQYASARNLAEGNPLWGSRPDQHRSLSQALALGSITHLSIAVSVRGSSGFLPQYRAYKVAGLLQIMLVPSLTALPQSEANYLEAGRFPGNVSAYSSLPGYEPSGNLIHLFDGRREV